MTSTQDRMPFLTRILKSLASFAIVAAATGCTAWRVDQRPVPDVVSRHQNDDVAISMRDLRWVVLRNPRIENDSVVGSWIGGNSYGKSRTALALSGVTAVETRRLSLIRTIALGVAVALLPTVWRFATVEEE